MIKNNRQSHDSNSSMKNQRRFLSQEIADFFSRYYLSLIRSVFDLFHLSGWNKSNAGYIKMCLINHQAGRFGKTTLLYSLLVTALQEHFSSNYLPYQRASSHPYHIGFVIPLSPMLVCKPNSRAI